MDLLTVKETAALMGIGVRHVRRLIVSNDIYAQEHINPDNNRRQYMIPAETLPEDLRRKYYAKLQKDTLALPVMPPVRADKPRKPSKTYEDMTHEERDEAALWTAVLQEWFKFRGQAERKADADKHYISFMNIQRPDLKLSRDKLYHKWAAYRAGDLAGLLDGRGGWNKGKTGIPPEAWNMFLVAYLDQRQIPITECYKLTKFWLTEFAPELVPDLPSERTFRRQVEIQVPKAVEELGRVGNKSFTDRCAPYIVRLYDDLLPNDYWIADNHTLDVISIKIENGREIEHRLSLTTFQDARSGVIVGWNVTDNPCSQSTILALRHAANRFGIPYNAYFDNGPEFLTHDIAGRGHRTRKTTDITKNPPPILTQMGIHMQNAEVRNAKAKPIERTFYTLKQQFSRSFKTFTGGNALERPENHTQMIKQGKAPYDSELAKIIADWIDGVYNVGDYGGAVAADHGKSRIDVWNEYIPEIRKATQGQLDLMLMRISRLQKIGQNGVHVIIAGEKLFYWDENTYLHFGEEVFVRYDPDDLETVRVYDREDRFLYTLPMARDTRIKFAADPEDVKVAMEKIRAVKKAARGKLKELTDFRPFGEQINILDLQIRRMYAGKAEFQIKPPKTVIMVRADEKEYKKLAAGQNPVDVSVSRMNQNAAKRRKK